MSRMFSVRFTEDPSALVAKAKKAAKTYGADFKEDATSGSFSGKGVRGIYSIQDRVVTVTIVDKPFFIPWGLVESQVRGFFD